MRAFQKQAMAKKQMCKKIISKQIGMDYNPGVQFQKSLINTDKSKSLTMNN